MSPFRLLCITLYNKQTTNGRYFLIPNCLYVMINAMMVSYLSSHTIGINYSTLGAISFTIGSITISLSGLAVGALTGIILNAILPDKDYTFDDDEPSDTGVNFQVGDHQKDAQ